MCNTATFFSLMLLKPGMGTGSGGPGTGVWEREYRSNSHINSVDKFKMGGGGKRRKQIKVWEPKGKFYPNK